MRATDYEINVKMKPRMVDGKLVYLWTLVKVDERYKELNVGLGYEKTFEDAVWAAYEYYESYMEQGD